MQAIQIEIDSVVTQAVCEAEFSGSFKDYRGKLSTECKIRKNAILGAIASSVCLQRLYFIIRSAIMGLITGIITFVTISALQLTDFFQLIILGIIAFFISLLFSRFLDPPIIRICSLILKYLNRFERARAFILSRL